MAFLQSLSKFFGRIFFGVGLSLLLLGIFAQMAFGTIDSLKGKTKTIVEDIIASPENLDLLTQSALPQGDSLEQFKRACAINPSTEECKQLEQLTKDPKTFIKSKPELQKQLDDQVNQIDQQVNGLIDRAKNYGVYTNYTLILAAVLIILGIILVYLGFMDWKESTYTLSVKGAIATGLAAVYYKIGQYFLNGDILSNQLGYGTSFVEPLQRVVVEWINPVFNKVFFLSLSLTIFFVIVAIGLYFIKKKDLKKSNKENKL